MVQRGGAASQFVGASGGSFQLALALGALFFQAQRTLGFEIHFQPHDVLPTAFMAFFQLLCAAREAINVLAQ